MPAQWCRTAPSTFLPMASRHQHLRLSLLQPHTAQLSFKLQADSCQCVITLPTLCCFVPLVPVATFILLSCTPYVPVHSPYWQLVLMQTQTVLDQLP